MVGTVHCMNPNFLENQLETTLSNLGLETLDLYYIHNPAESQLPLVGYEKYMERLTVNIINQYESLNSLIVGYF